ncbi:MAG: hypothetical protein FH756_04685 [Firmicutes bacterium]|nr:hypothetical protein [Bacillota bacterium]
MKGKVWVLILGVLLVAAIVAPTAFASWQSARMDTSNYPNVMNADYQDMTVMPAADDAVDTGQDTPQDSSSQGSNYNYPDFDEETFNEFHDQMFDWGENWAEQSQQNGQLSPDQAQAWQDHFAYMNDFHNQMGYNGMMGMMGGMMGGYGYGMNGNYNSN